MLIFESSFQWYISVSLLLETSLFDKAITTSYGQPKKSLDDTILYHHIGDRSHLVEMVISSFHDFVRETFSVVPNRKWGIPFLY